MTGGGQHTKDFHFPALVNGLDFLVSAVDSLSGDNGQPGPRDVKYAVLHLQAAVETLLKARLEMHSPELVWTKVGAFDQRKHEAGDFSSCSVKKALERLHDTVQIESTIDPEEDSLKQLGNLRNRIMHFGWKDTVVAVQARTIPVLDLLVSFVNTDVLPHVDQPAEAWSAEQQMEQVRAGFKHLTDFIALRMQGVRGQLEGYEHATAACRSCGQFAVVLDGGAHDLACLLCGKQYGTGEEAAWEFIGASKHVSIKDGGGDLDGCGTCGAYAVIRTPLAYSPEEDTWLCFGCGSSFEGVCAFCGQATDLAPRMEDMCSDCYEIRLDNF
ncbi:hypothetical protein [Streptomyces cellostaticus]|uniref:hypothetical protein n=1 Tax=Streptomyces cellostaticus TaxID=67285 RepID=UPI00202644DC|nr:hypothetical protein [Streptomyces cellostaticus]